MLPPHYQLLLDKFCALDSQLYQEAIVAKRRAKSSRKYSNQDQNQFMKFNAIKKSLETYKSAGMDTTILKQMLQVKPGVYQVRWIKEMQDATYKLEIAFPPFDKKTKRQSSLSQSEDQEDDDTNNSPQKFKRQIVLQERATQFKRLLLNQCLYHYQRALAHIPQKKRPKYNPAKEMVWPSWFNIKNVPQIPPSGLIPQKPTRNSSSKSLRQYLQEKTQIKDTFIQKAYKEAMKKSIEQQEQKKSRNFQSSPTSNQSSPRQSPQRSVRSLSQESSISSISNNRSSSSHLSINRVNLDDIASSKSSIPQTVGSAGQNLWKNNPLLLSRENIKKFGKLRVSQSPARSSSSTSQNRYKQIIKKYNKNFQPSTQISVTQQNNPPIQKRSSQSKLSQPLLTKIQNYQKANQQFMQMVNERQLQTKKKGKQQIRRRFRDCVRAIFLRQQKKAFQIDQIFKRTKQQYWTQQKQRLNFNEFQQLLDANNQDFYKQEVIKGIVIVKIKNK